MISVPNYNILTELPKGHLKNGELAETTDDNKKWVYDDENQNWREYETAGIQMSLYDMNKQLMAQMPPMEDTDTQKEIINNFKEATENNHYMLLCNELNYFTLFERSDTTEHFENLVLECIGDVGIIHDMTLVNNDTAIEIWAMSHSGEMFCMYLFPYDQGVVYFK